MSKKITDTSTPGLESKPEDQIPTDNTQEEKKATSDFEKMTTEANNQPISLSAPKEKQKKNLAYFSRKTRIFQ
jgi:hypothetical protein